MVYGEFHVYLWEGLSFVSLGDWMGVLVLGILVLYWVLYWVSVSGMGGIGMAWYCSVIRSWMVR
jgi:hypothetical protein